MLVKIFIVVALIFVAFFAWQAISRVIVWDQGSFQAKTNTLDTAREKDVNTMGKHLKDFALNNSGEYPATVDILVKDGYITSIPPEPTGASYFYWVASNRQSASYYARLETDSVYCWGSFNGARQVQTPDDCQP